MSFLLGTLVYSMRETVFKILLQFKDVLYRCAFFLLTSTVLVWIAVFLYGTFYYTYMPAVSHVKPVHFQFKNCPPSNGPCSFPSANVSLVKKGRDQLLMRGQQYKVYLDLEMPESSRNKELGMFMVKIDLSNKKGEVLYSSSRLAILHYRSPLMHILNIFFYSPLLLMGSMEEKQIINVELFDYYEEDPWVPSVSAFLEIQSYNIEIYSASLGIYAHFTGLRYIMFHWPLISAVVGVGTNLFFLSVIALLSWYRYTVSSEKTQLVVRVGFEENNAKRIEERRRQVKEFLLRERQRQADLENMERDIILQVPETKKQEYSQTLETLPEDKEIPSAEECSEEMQTTKENGNELSEEMENMPQDSSSDDASPEENDPGLRLRRIQELSDAGTVHIS